MHYSLGLQVQEYELVTVVLVSFGEECPSSGIRSEVMTSQAMSNKEEKYGMHGQTRNSNVFRDIGLDDKEERNGGRDTSTKNH